MNAVNPTRLNVEMGKYQYIPKENNCEIFSTIFTDFTGSFGVLDSRGKNLTELDGIPSEKFGRISQFILEKSLNKQDFIPNLSINKK